MVLKSSTRNLAEMTTQTVSMSTFAEDPERGRGWSRKLHLWITCLFIPDISTVPQRPSTPDVVPSAVVTSSIPDDQDNLNSQSRNPNDVIISLVESLKLSKMDRVKKRMLQSRRFARLKRVVSSNRDNQVVVPAEEGISTGNSWFRDNQSRPRPRPIIRNLEKDSEATFPILRYRDDAERNIREYYQLKTAGASKKENLLISCKLYAQSPVVTPIPTMVIYVRNPEHFKTLFKDFPLARRLEFPWAIEKLGGTFYRLAKTCDDSDNDHGFNTQIDDQSFKTQMASLPSYHGIPLSFYISAECIGHAVMGGIVQILDAPFGLTVEHCLTLNAERFGYQSPTRKDSCTDNSTPVEDSGSSKSDHDDDDDDYDGDGWGLWDGLNGSSGRGTADTTDTARLSLIDARQDAYTDPQNTIIAKRRDTGEPVGIVCLTSRTKTAIADSFASPSLSCDWALIRFFDAFDPRSVTNLQPEPNLLPKLASANQDIINPSGLSNISRDKVSISAIGIQQKGTINRDGRLLAVAGIDGCLPVYSMSHQSPLEQGSSGVWVIDAQGDVVGHIIAGAVDKAISFCLPVNTIFNSITEKLGLTHLSSSHHDRANWIQIAYNHHYQHRHQASFDPCSSWSLAIWLLLKNQREISTVKNLLLLKPSIYVVMAVIVELLPYYDREPIFNSALLLFIEYTLSMYNQNAVAVAKVGTISYSNFSLNFASSRWSEVKDVLEQLSDDLRNRTPFNSDVLSSRLRDMMQSHLQEIGGHWAPGAHENHLPEQTSFSLVGRLHPAERELLPLAPIVGSKKALGKEHLPMLDLDYNKAEIYRHQGRYAEALELYRRVLAGYEALGNKYLSELDTVFKIAIVYRHQSRYKDALKWYGIALAGYEKVLGKEHPSALTAIFHSAIVYCSLRSYQEALEWYERALAGYEKALGMEHPSTLDIVYNMAIIYRHEGRYKEALEWYERALAGYEKQLGNEHLSTLNTVYSLGDVYERTQNYEQALEYYQAAREGYEKVSGPNYEWALKAKARMSLVKMQLLELAGGDEAVGKRHWKALKARARLSRKRWLLHSALHSHYTI